ncbi:hypothetical protein RE6C_00697 [Rhodopirellula europaea 6C]|uniref:Uncharacterized protein n=1 Tax=Rhodopirellula europaea 6C TaxID=1263867 RepID=M2BA85_9BACT|nr:hypothetical protein RE6C_00697 [Rhodopirellula europaea 6C]
MIEASWQQCSGKRSVERWLPFRRTTGANAQTDRWVKRSQYLPDWLATSMFAGDQ